MSITKLNFDNKRIFDRSFYRTYLIGILVKLEKFLYLLRNTSALHYIQYIYKKYDPLIQYIIYRISLKNSFKSKQF